MAKNWKECPKTGEGINLNDGCDCTDWFNHSCQHGKVMTQAALDKEAFLINNPDSPLTQAILEGRKNQ